MARFTLIKKGKIKDIAILSLFRLQGGGCCFNKDNQNTQPLLSQSNNKDKKEQEKSKDQMSNQETDVDSPQPKSYMNIHQPSQENSIKKEMKNQVAEEKQNGQKEKSEHQEKLGNQEKVEKQQEQKIDKSEELLSVPSEFQEKEESQISKLQKKILEQKGKDIVKQVGKYALRQRLGVGAFGKVYLATLMELAEPITFFAIKEMPLRSGPTSKIVRCLLTKREINNMIRVQHINIVQLIDVVFTSNNCYLVMEYCEGGNLKEYVKANSNYITENNVLYIAKQMAEGLRALNQNYIIHRDIKPENILLSASGPTPILKICDLGFSKNIKDESEGKTKCGTQQYMAHEILKGKTKYNYKVDLWSLGIILYEMLSGNVSPFSGISDYQIVINQLIGSNMDKLNCSEQCKDFIANLLQCQDSKRMSFQEFYNHPWLKSSKVEKLEPNNKLFAAQLQSKQSDINLTEAANKINENNLKTQQLMQEIELIQEGKENGLRASLYLVAATILKQQKDQFEQFRKQDSKIQKGLKDLDGLQDKCGEQIFFCREYQLSDQNPVYISIQEIEKIIVDKYSSYIQHLNETKLKNLVESALSYIGILPTVQTSEYWQEQGYWVEQEDSNQPLQDQEKSVMKETDKSVMKESEKSLMKETDKSVMKESEKSLMKETDKSVMKESEKSLMKEQKIEDYEWE